MGFNANPNIMLKGIIEMHAYLRVNKIFSFTLVIVSLGALNYGIDSLSVYHKNEVC